MRGRLLTLTLILLILLPAINAEVTPEVEQILETEEETEVIIELRNNEPLPMTTETKFSKQSTNEKPNIKIKHQFKDAISGTITKQGLEQLKHNPNILIRKPMMYKKSMDVSGPAIQSHQTNGLVYNNQNITGQGIGVCVIDSGIDYEHTDLGGCNLISFLAGDCEKVVYGWDFVNDDNNPMDDEGHGTHVAGTVASTHSTYRGIAPGAHLIAMKALDAAGDGSEANIAEAIKWCVDNATIYNISVITMSLGTDTLYTGYCESTGTIINTQINRARANNITVTVSTGNAGSTTQISHPACVQNATAIGAVNDANGFVYNRNNVTDFVAPGVNIISTQLSGTTTSLSGTSMACPHAAGAFALMSQFNSIHNKGLTVSQMESVFTTSALELNDTSSSNLLYSKLQIYDAITSTDSTPPTITLLTPNTSTTGNIHINITSTSLNTAILTFQDTNETLSGRNKNWHTNKTELSGTYVIKIYANDSTGNWATPIQQSIEVTNKPIINNYTPNNLTPSLQENSYLNFNHTASDFDNDTLSHTYLLDGLNVSHTTSYTYTTDYESSGTHNLTVEVTDTTLTTTRTWIITVHNVNRAPNITEYSPGTQTTLPENSSQLFNHTSIDLDNDTLTYSWKLDNTQVATTPNYTYTTSFESNGSHNLTLYVNDSYDLTAQFWNVTVTNVNRPPTFITANNLTINETELGTIIANATDLDNESITYYYTPYFNSSGQWTPNSTDEDIYNIQIIASDAQINVTTNITVTVLNVQDFDNDNIRDETDTDDDNDGIADTDDYLLGNATNIDATIPGLQISINQSTNLSQIFNTTLSINITNNNITIIFNYTLNSTNLLNLGQLQINHTNQNNTQYITVSPINTSDRKTITLTNQSNNSNGVCIKDAVINHLSEVSQACTGTSETLLRCPATSGQYTCAVTSTTYTISGLTHSTIREQCIESWTCSTWSDCANSQQSRTCTDEFNCGTTYSKPILTQSCTTNNGNTGGGGGGGSTYTAQNTTQPAATEDPETSSTSTEEGSAENTTTTDAETQNTEPETTEKTNKTNQTTGFAILKNKAIMTRAGIVFGLLLLLTLIYLKFRAPSKKSR